LALCIYPGPPLELSFDFLAQSATGPAVYFVDSDGPRQVARWIPSVAVFDKYHFRWDSVGEIDQSWLDSHVGPNWD